MEEREKVWRHLTALGGKAARGAVVAALTVSMMPISAFAYEGTEAGSTATNTVPTSAQLEGQTPSTSDYSVQLASEGVAGVSSYDLSKIADGTYEADVAVSDDGATIDGVSTGVEDDEFVGYSLSVKVTVADHKIIKVEAFDRELRIPELHEQGGQRQEERHGRSGEDRRRAVRRCRQRVKCHGLELGHQGRCS